MYSSFDAFEYVEYLRRRWGVFVLACLVAVIIVVPVSLLIPKRFTATATIVIDPPENSDSRTAIVVSPMYLESLRGYERFAADDQLFARAAAKFHLQNGGPIEALKRAVLKVNKLRDTRILEISVTWRDPKLAQKVAEYLANETVAMSRGQAMDADRRFVEEAEKQAASARARLKQEEQAWAALSRQEPLEPVERDLQSSGDLEARLRQQLADVDADIAEYQTQSEKTDSQFAREQLQSALARKTVLQKKHEEVQRAVVDLGRAASGRSAKRDALQNELAAAQTISDAAEKRLGEELASAGKRGDQLRVLDPGIIPEQPSSPNVSLNVAAALLFALVASLVYLSLAFVMRRRPVGFEPQIAREMRR